LLSSRILVLWKKACKARPQTLRLLREKREVWLRTLELKRTSESHIIIIKVGSSLMAVIRKAKRTLSLRFLLVTFSLLGESWDLRGTLMN
jgi:hypothetical protein